MCSAGDVWLNKQCPVDTKDGVLTQRSAVDQPDSAFRPAQQKHKGAADERAVVDRVLLTSNDDAQVGRCWLHPSRAPCWSGTERPLQLQQHAGKSVLKKGAHHRVANREE